MSMEFRMINQGQALIDDVNAAEVPAGQMALWWMGQHSFIAKAGQSVIYIDPFLSPHPDRQVPPMLEPVQVTNADVICGSHDHLDHIDRDIWPTLSEASPEATFVAPSLFVEKLAKDIKVDSNRFAGLDDSKTLDIGEVRITGVAAAHEFLDQDPVTKHFPYLGFIFQSHGSTLYHAGDTCWYDGLQAKLKDHLFDAMLLPINGRDAKRLADGIIGNMTYQEAADLAGPLQPGLVVPTHYDMFAGNPGDPKAFTDYVKVKYPYVPTHVCSYGERIMIGVASDSIDKE